LSWLADAEKLPVVVETEGRLPVPPSLWQTLGLVSGDLLVLTRNFLSVRLDPLHELVQDVEGSVKSGVSRWLDSLHAGFRVPVGSDGSVPIPSDLLALPLGGKFLLEVVTGGLRSTLYVYRCDE
jgi:hypothetical protein